MSMTNKLGDNQEFMTELRDCAKTLAERLQADDYEEASDLLQKLYKVRDEHLFNAVGRLTRALHDAIVNFNVDAEDEAEAQPAIDATQCSEISDASDRLNYVIKMTQEAADKTMDRVETAAPIAESLGHEAARLRAEWERLRRREMTKDEFAELYQQVDEFLEKMGGGVAELNHNLQAIILEQGFQDLTGQVLRKVIGLVTDVEAELVNLMRIAGQVEEVTGISHETKKIKKTKKEATSRGEGPQIHAGQRADVVTGQDDVDDLLSSLGF